jgi:hypothetical protein
MGLIWTVCLSLCASLIPIFGISPFTLNIDFQPIYWTTIINLPWFFLLVSILAIAIKIYLFLRAKAKRDRLKKLKIKTSLVFSSALMNMNQNNSTQEASTLPSSSSGSSRIYVIRKRLKNYRFPAEKKFLIIMVIFDLLFKIRVVEFKTKNYKKIF